MPRFLVFLQHFIDDVHQGFFSIFRQPIPLRVVSCGISQTNVILVAEIYEFLQLKSSCIISYNLSRTSKERQDIILKEFDNNRVSGLPSWYLFDPFGKIIGGSENPPMLA
jgi:hypothetical protein